MGPPHLRRSSGTALQGNAHLLQRCSDCVQLCSCPLYQLQYAKWRHHCCIEIGPDNRPESLPEARGQQDSIRRTSDTNTSRQPQDRGLWIESTCWSGPPLGPTTCTTPSNQWLLLPVCWHGPLLCCSCLSWSSCGPPNPVTPASSVGAAMARPGLSLLTAWAVPLQRPSAGPWFSCQSLYTNPNDLLPDHLQGG